MNKTVQLSENIVLGLIFAVFAFMLYVARTAPSYSSGGDTASMTFPSYIFGITMFACAMKLCMNLFGRLKVKEKEIPLEKRHTDVRVYVTLVAIIIYAFAWNLIGFSLSSVLFVSLVSKMLRPSYHYGKALIVAVSVTLCINILFVYLFKIDFPEPMLDLLYAI